MMVVIVVVVVVTADVIVVAEVVEGRALSSRCSFNFHLAF